MTYHLNMREVVYSLSEALDYVGIDDTMHGKRVAYMASEIGRYLGWYTNQIDDIMQMGMLHDCGVSSTDVHHYLVSELDWDNSQIHCDRGAQLLQKVERFRDFSTTILYHHTHWDTLPQNLDSKTKDQANLIYLVDRIDSLRIQKGWQKEEEKEQIRSVIRNYSGVMFAPHLVEAFIALSTRESFWFYMEPDALGSYFTEWIIHGENEPINFLTLKNIAQMFADVVDAKSTFTSEHTYGVASLARYLSQLHGFSTEIQEKIELAAYFHDLGKLRVADAILHKQGPLNEEERAHMNHHGFDSHLILQRIKGLQEIGKIASMHHETLDGKGYPYHLSSDQIPLEARILAISDIFQALVQQRPYRDGLDAHEAYRILQSMSQAEKIDAHLLALMEAHLDECYTHAMYPQKD